MKPAELAELLIPKTIGTAVGCSALWIAANMGWEILRCGPDVGALTALANVFIGLPITGLVAVMGCIVLYTTYFELPDSPK